MLYNPDEKKKYLKNCLSAKRFTHSLNVAAECRKLAENTVKTPTRLILRDFSTIYVRKCPMMCRKIWS